MVKKERGFTLIELLVVIAIIGILSSVVLASLNTARAKANDAKVKAQLAGMRASAEIYYSNQTPNSYGVATGACGATPSGMFADVASGMAQYSNATTNYPTGTTITCNVAAAGAAYAASANLSTGFWCVDSTGQSKAEAATLGAATVCA